MVEEEFLFGRVSMPHYGRLLMQMVWLRKGFCLGEFLCLTMADFSCRCVRFLLIHHVRTMVLVELKR